MHLPTRNCLPVFFVEGPDLCVDTLPCFSPATAISGILRKVWQPIFHGESIWSDGFEQLGMGVERHFRESLIKDSSSSSSCVCVCVCVCVRVRV